MSFVLYGYTLYHQKYLRFSSLLNMYDNYARITASLSIQTKRAFDKLNLHFIKELRNSLISLKQKSGIHNKIEM